MMRQANLTKREKHVAARMTPPSPLAGEGITDRRSGYRQVRGTNSDIAKSSPLTRLRFAKPPSPARGEGKRPATQRGQIA
jgi:hypothetical protein